MKRKKARTRTERHSAAVLLALWWLLFPAAVSADTPLRNQLEGHASPYLAMHGDDPVHWQAWGRAAFERAQRENKLLFVSSGYFTCHWCHVMQRESYRDASVAATINAHFIPVKIDRELLPDVDSGLIDFAEHTRGQAGWPLNVFITPAGHPLIAVLYLPPQTFHEFLRSLAQRWSDEGSALAALAAGAAESMTVQPHEQRVDYAVLRRDYLDKALSLADELGGGFGAQSKFPQVPQLWALLELHADLPDPRIASFINVTLEQMASQGLRDHLAGGFFRYTVDPAWQQPHFEKMLYDNAQLARLYLRAAQQFDRPEWADVARDTLDFVLDHMRAPQGGYVSALSAVDGQGTEGGHYLWDKAEIQALAGDDWPWVERYWQLHTASDFDAGHHLIPITDSAALAAEFQLSQPQLQTRIRNLRKLMLQRRTERELPVDTKVLTGWNSLLLIALVEAAQAFEAENNKGRYTQAAVALRDYLLGRHWTDDGWVRMRAAGAQTPATLEDYAYTLEALQRGVGLWGDQVASERIEQTRLHAWERFYRDGLWWYGPNRLLKWRSGATALADGALPSPAVVLMRATPARSQSVTQALSVAATQVQAQPFLYPGYLHLYRRNEKGAP